jgi:hypothetical protein
MLVCECQREQRGNEMERRIEPVHQVQGHHVVVLDESPIQWLVAEIQPRVLNGEWLPMPKCVEVIENPRYDGNGVDVIWGGQTDQAKLEIYGRWG